MLVWQFTINLNCILTNKLHLLANDIQTGLEECKNFNNFKERPRIMVNVSCQIFKEDVQNQILLVAK